MIFKQSVLKEEKIKFLIGLMGVLVIDILLLIVCINHKEPFELLLFFSLIFFLPLLILMVLIGLNNLEWFCIYNDRIEVKCVYGIKNTVYFENVLFIEETVINLTTRGMKKTFYIFNDGRENNGGLFGINSCYNRKRFNLRVYKTKKLEDYIRTLNIKVNEN